MGLLPVRRDWVLGPQAGVRGMKVTASGYGEGGVCGLCYKETGEQEGKGRIRS